MAVMSYFLHYSFALFSCVDLAQISEQVSISHCFIQTGLNGGKE